MKKKAPLDKFIFFYLCQLFLLLFGKRKKWQKHGVKHSVV